MDRHGLDNHDDPPPPYESLSDPRPPPPDGNPAFASGRPNGLDAWDFNNHQGSPAAGRRRQTSDTFFGTFDLRDMDEYVEDPFAPPSEPGRPTVVKGRSDLKWFYCHYKVFPAYWRCPRCPPNDCFHRWDMGAMLDVQRHDLPTCPRPGCLAKATDESFLVNAQKEDITTVSGANLMESRAQDSFMWCCRCWSLRGYMANDQNGCAHCADCTQSECRDCVRCNKFLEPTRLCTGDLVYKGVMDLHARAVAIMEGRSPDSIAEFRSRVLDEMPDHLHDGTDFERACRALTLSVRVNRDGPLKKQHWLAHRSLRRPPPGNLFSGSLFLESLFSDNLFSENLSTQSFFCGQRGDLSLFPLKLSDPCNLSRTYTVEYQLQTYTLRIFTTTTTAAAAAVLRSPRQKA
ncbi:uncharacterized protein B0T15DRAFT_546033 [Chaetomium strumarium]|uniref:Uncharacterized protein n=1 Tax=Chaetomium strumarium TaxID=1170767 RepID=A0AAJ0H1M3_9PEZI|nr:hypothetical protein B0T15DRAFT_546033 [Chaetomium strumarium]